MQTYLVGGAVRDTLLGRKVREKDYVVINETPARMLARGYKQVGKDFPVFLHPKTHEEYALARKERKTEIGHHGFAMDIEKVSLEEDLLRRDLTINAMAISENNELIDPYGGQKDLENKILRHVSSAFSEDPLRVFRTARFQAMLPVFSIHNTTMALMLELCATPLEIQSLSSERIWNEVVKASQWDDFHLFWSTLLSCGALQALSIDIDEDFLKNIKTSTEKGIFRFVSALWHHPNPKVFNKLNLPTDVSDALRIIHSNREVILTPSKDPLKILKTILRLDPFRREDRAVRIINTLNNPVLQNYWNNLINVARLVDIKPIIEKHKTGLADLIFNARLEAIRHSLENK